MHQPRDAVAIATPSIPGKPLTWGQADVGDRSCLEGSLSLPASSRLI